MSRYSQAVGSSLEDCLAFVHNLYAAHGVWVRHNGIAGVWRISHRTGQREFTPIGRQAAPDYYGCARGHFVAFDAKTTDKPSRWRLDKEQGHQYMMLMDLAGAGATCWFAVEQRSQQVLHLLRILPGCPWPIIVFDSRGLPDRLEVPWTGSVGGYDWLNVVKAGWLA